MVDCSVGPEDEKASAAALPEEDQPKKGRKVLDEQPLTQADRSQLDAMVEETVDRGQREKVRAVLRPQGIRKIIGDHRGHLRSVEDALLIADRWNPRNQNKGEVKEKVRNDDGEVVGEKVVGLPKGNFHAIDEVEQDAVYLAALNAKISTIWSISKGAVNRAEAHLATVKAEAKRATAEAKRAGHLKGKIGTVDQVENLAKTVKAVKEAEEDLLSVQEQAEILGGCYFAMKDLAQVLVERVKTLRGEWRQAARQPA